MSTNFQALYYPFIHFKSDDWLKVSALYWDKIGRIVPEDFTTKDSPTVCALKPIIEDCRPNWVLPDFGESFVEFIDQYRAKLQERYAVARSETWRETSQEQQPPKLVTPQPHLRFGYVYFEKLSSGLRDALTGSGLATIHIAKDANGPRGEERWVGMHPRLATVYMTALAEQLAAERGMRPLTDEAFDHIAVSGFSIERLAHALLGDVELVDAKPTATEVETALVSIAFRAVVPKGIANLNIDKILAFREKYPEERRRFQSSIGELVKAREWLTSIKDRKILEERLIEEYERTLESNLTELEEKLNEAGIDTIWACFNLKAALPSGIAGAASLIATTLNPVAAATAGFALAVIPALRDKRKAAREKLRAAPETYLYRMKQDLTPLDLAARIKKQAMQFALQV